MVWSDLHWSVIRPNGATIWPNSRDSGANRLGPAPGDTPVCITRGLVTCLAAPGGMHHCIAPWGVHRSHPHTPEVVRVQPPHVGGPVALVTAICCWDLLLSLGPVLCRHPVGSQMVVCELLCWRPCSPPPVRRDVATQWRGRPLFAKDCATQCWDQPLFAETGCHSFGADPCSLRQGRRNIEEGSTRQ